MGDIADSISSVIEAARQLGVELDADEAIAWISQVSKGADDLIVDVDSGVYGHKVTMSDLDPADIARYRHIGRIVGFEDRPPDVLTALALSGSAAQNRVHRFPGDADFFERIHIRAGTRDEACSILADLMREKAVSKMKGSGYRLQEVKFGSWPFDATVDGNAVRAGSPVSWSPEQVEAGAIPYTAATGEERVLGWAEAAVDPGWCKLDWVVADPENGGVANASNVLDVTWEAPDGSVIPLDGFLDPHFQEVYLEMDSLPLFNRLVEQMGSDPVADYVDRLNAEVYKYTVESPNYGKAARRMYNVFRLTGRYAEAAYVRELFDEPVTALYQVAALLRTIHEASEGGDSFQTDAMVGQIDQLIMSAVAGLEGRAEVEMARHLLRLRDAVSRADTASIGGEVSEARAEAMNAVNEYFESVLTAVPAIKSYLDELASNPPK